MDDQARVNTGYRRTRIEWRTWGLLSLEASWMLIAISITVLVLWLVLSRPNSKLYEADNVVCVSQPFSSQCFERKSNP